MGTRFLEKTRCGFTLIELLLVIGIIAILAAIVIVALNPTEKGADPRNAQRRSDINNIVNAVLLYQVDKEELPGCLATGSGGHICLKGSECDGVEDGCNLDDITETYVTDLPIDPLGATGNDTNYVISVANGRITVIAPKAENGVSISVTK
jgi:type IV pilus assembly protein PilA